MNEAQPKRETMRKLSFTSEEKESLAKMGVAALILFGSQAQGVAGPMRQNSGTRRY